MKRLLISSFVLFTLFSTTSFAENRCLLQLDKRTVNHELNLNDCDINFRGNIETTNLQIIMSYLLKHPEIKTLNLSGNGITANGGALLSTTTTLTTLNLAFNHLGDDGATALAKNKYLTDLNLEYNHINDKGGTAIAKDETLRSLNLDGNDLTDQSAYVIAEHKSINKLGIFSTHITSPAITAIVKNKALTSLHLFDLDETAAQTLLQNNKLQDLAVFHTNMKEQTLTTLVASPQLHSLTLGNTKSEVTEPVIKALTQNSSLKKLTIEYTNNLSEKAFMAFANNKHLQELTLGSGNTYTKTTVKALSSIPTLTHLSISELTDDAMRELAKNQHLISLSIGSRFGMTDSTASEFSKNKSITSLEISANSLSENGISSIANMPSLITLRMINVMHLTPKATQTLADNQHLIELSMLIGKISNTDAIILSKNKSLKRLKLNTGDITDEGALAFVNNNYDSLDLGSNFISPDAVATLMQNLAITELYLGGQK